MPDDTPPRSIYSPVKPENEAAPRKGRKSGGPAPEQMVAWWQRLLMWVLWLGFLALAFSNTESGDGFTVMESLLLFAAAGVTIWSYIDPRGGDAIFFESAADLEGEFESRTNWAMMLLGALLTLGGVAGFMRTAFDYFRGFSTLWGILEDMGTFVVKFWLQFVVGVIGVDCTEGSRLYILMVLLLPGGILFLATLIPFLCRGVPYRISADAPAGKEGEGGAQLLEFWHRGKWLPLAPEHFGKIVADSEEIVFSEPTVSTPDAVTEVGLPLGRVFSRKLGTRVKPGVLSRFFHKKLVASGYKIRFADGEEDSLSWTATKADAVAGTPSLSAEAAPPIPQG
ncbi:hypothetical protein DB346_07925 [Verrucomicrobia bacterium LW23]|nr:hypothetical protein DB346_07925 [Verrucomicrobia bacterium LW23]